MSSDSEHEVTMKRKKKDSSSDSDSSDSDSDSSTSESKKRKTKSRRKEDDKKGKKNKDDKKSKKHKKSSKIEDIKKRAKEAKAARKTDKKIRKAEEKVLKQQRKEEEKRDRKRRKLLIEMEHQQGAEEKLRMLERGFDTKGVQMALVAREDDSEVMANARARADELAKQKAEELLRKQGKLKEAEQLQSLLSGEAQQQAGTEGDEPQHWICTNPTCRYKNLWKWNECHECGGLNFAAKAATLDRRVTSNPNHNLFSKDGDDEKKKGASTSSSSTKTGGAASSSSSSAAAAPPPPSTMLAPNSNVTYSKFVYGQVRPWSHKAAARGSIAGHGQVLDKDAERVMNFYKDLNKKLKLEHRGRR
ncbi:unnamed protein product [Amoebophrya sp. A25]|nr:unnamed protein product [Amoebophrya sp. A25]|eukprot:GSA25T00000246001.1